MEDIFTLPPEARLIIEIVFGLGIVALLSPLWLWVIYNAFDSVMHIFWWLTYDYRHKRKVRFGYSFNWKKFFQPPKKRKYKPCKPEDFRPWQGDFYIACVLWTFGLAWISSALYAYKEIQSYIASALGMLAIAPLYFGFSWFESGLSRRRGKVIEEEEKRVLKSMLPEGWEALPDVLMEKGGDIDLSLSLRGGEVCVIDIKSWNYWSGFVRKREALRQVYSQKKYMKTQYGIIWLPKAKEKSVRFEWNIMIVCGRIKFLFNCIEDMLKRNTAAEVNDDDGFATG